MDGMNASEQPGSATGAPTFSIIMPAYNCRPWIRQSVLSVLGQSEPDFELIIVDDASSDGTLDAVADLAQGDARIRLIRTSANAGAASARNAGLQASRGRLLAFLDADDLYEPTRLAAHLAVFDAFPDAAMVFSDFRGFGDGGEEASYLVAQRNLAQSAAPHMEGPLCVRGSDADVYRCRASLATFASVHYNVVYMHCVTLARAARNARV
jgi:glycosyltransferase involved in cell wall biosynthesis